MYHYEFLKNKYLQSNGIRACRRNLGNIDVGIRTKDCSVCLHFNAIVKEIRFPRAFDTELGTSNFLVGILSTAAV